MSKVKIGMERLSIPAEVIKVGSIVTQMTGNASFPAPAPSLSEVTAAKNALNAAYQSAEAARNDSKAKTLAQGAAETALMGVVSKLADYVNTASGGDEPVILSSGFEVAADATPAGLPGKPENFSLTAGDKPGEVHGHFDAVKYGRTYKVQYLIGPNPSGSWLNGDPALKSNFDLEDLTSGDRVWVRLQAVGTAGTGPWSDPVSVIVP